MPQHALVVDDDLAMCELIQTILRSADMEALISTDSSSALEFLRIQKFDAVFLDVNMPSPNGIELIRQMRASGSNKKTPAIMITGDEDPTVLSRGFQAGANFFLFKPINKQRLLNLSRTTHSAVQREKRHYQRVVVNCKAQVQLDQEILDGDTVDISLNGVLVRTAKAFPVGSKVDMRLFPQPGAQPIAAAGKVVRMAGPHMGIHIENIGSDASKRLQNFLLPLILAVPDSEASANR